MLLLRPGAHNWGAQQDSIRQVAGTNPGTGSIVLGQGDETIIVNPDSINLGDGLVKTSADLPANGNPDRGSQLFAAQCAICHNQTLDGKPLAPNRTGVFNHTAGTNDGGYLYSQALRRSLKIWDSATLDAYIADPSGFIPGNLMHTYQYPGHHGPSQDERNDLIAYLAGLKS